jgi:hypothetical protein
MDEALTRTLALMAERLNPRAQAGLVGLLPQELGGEVQKELQEGGEERAPSSPLEERLLIQLAPPVPEEESEAEEEPEMEAVGSTDYQPEEEPVLPVLLGLLGVVAEPTAAAEFLVLLPAHLQGQITLKIATSNSLNITRGLGEEERELVERLRRMLPEKETLGVEGVCAILREIPTTRQLRRAINAADDQDHEKVTILQNHLFVFEDLLRLSDPELQMLLMRTDSAVLAQAMQMTAEKVRKRLLGNISQRRRVLVEEELERWGNATLAEIESAQLNILTSIRHLYEQGMIATYFGSVDRGGEERSPELGEEEQESEEEQEEEKDTPKGKGIGISPAAILLPLALVAVAWLAKDVFQGDRSGESLTSPRTVAGDALRKKPMRVMVQAEGGGEENAAGGGNGQLGAGESLKTPAGVRAMLELPRNALFELEELTEVERPPDDTEGEGGELYLRVGRVRTTVLDQGFKVETPIVEIIGRTGAVFHTRVVLDASTIVEVERGTVEVISLRDKKIKWLLKEGKVGRFHSNGGADIGESGEEKGTGNKP